MSQPENKPLTTIRGIAALWVLGYHVGIYFFTEGIGSSRPYHLFTYGYTAVDIFFILSGFILCTAYPCLRRSQIKPFFIKRFFRVYPLHLTVLLGLGALVGVMHAVHMAIPHPSHYSSAGFVAELFLMQPALFHSVVWNGPAWSLSVEAFCYVTFPLLLLIKSLNRPAKWILLSFTGVAEVILLRSYGEATVGVGAYARGLVGFTIGILLHSLLVSNRPTTRARAIIVETGGLCVLAAAFLTSSAALFPIAGAIMIVALAWQGGFVSSLFSTPALYRIGETSFSIYLLHVPVMISTRAVFKLIATHAGWSTTSPAYYVCSLAALCAVIFLLSEITFRYVEQPGRRLAKRFVPSRTRKQYPAVPVQLETVTLHETNTAALKIR